MSKITKKVTNIVASGRWDADTTFDQICFWIEAVSEVFGIVADTSSALR